MNWLHTDGKYVKDPSGKIIRLTGLNFPRLDMPHNWWGSLENWFNEDLIALHPPIIRLNIATNNWPAYKNEIDGVINFCKQNNIYVLFDCHVIGDSENMTFKAVWNEPLKTMWLNWLSDVAEAYKDEPTVCGIGLLNEPPWSELNTTAKLQKWIDVATEAVDLLSAINPNLLFFVAGAGGVLWDPQWRNQPRAPFIDRPNCVFEGHTYPYLLIYTDYRDYSDHPWLEHYLNGDFTRGWTEMEAFMVDRIYGIREGIPVFIGEYGLEYRKRQDGATIPDYEPFPNAWKVTADLLKFFKKYELGYAGFAYGWGQIWGLINQDGTPRPLLELMSQDFPTPTSPLDMLIRAAISAASGVGLILLSL